MNSGGSMSVLVISFLAAIGIGFGIGWTSHQSTVGDDVCDFARGKYELAQEKAVEDATYRLVEAAMLGAYIDGCNVTDEQAPPDERYHF